MSASRARESMTGRRWPSAPDRTTSRRLWLGFGTLTALLVLSTIAILARIQSIEWHVVETASDARRIAILHDVQGIVSFASALLIVSASVAVVMSTVVGSGIVKAERELWASREGLRVTLASIGDAVITTDASGNVTYLNAVAKDQHGWTHDDTRDRPLAAVFNIIDERTRQPVNNPVRKVRRRGQVLKLANHTNLVNKDSTERPIDDSAAPIRDDQGRVVGVVLVFHDITERRIAEHALRRSERELTEGLRDADRRKDEFLATLAHELRDPLAAMRSSLEVMRRCAADVGTLQLARDAMERQSRQLLRLVDDLLDVR